MKQIYMNAQITICVDDTPGCTLGCWHWDENEFSKINESCWVRDGAEADKEVLSIRG